MFQVASNKVENTFSKDKTVSYTTFISKSKFALSDGLFLDIFNFNSKILFYKNNYEHFPHTTESCVDIYKILLAHKLL